MQNIFSNRNFKGELKNGLSKSSQAMKTLVYIIKDLNRK